MLDTNNGIMLDTKTARHRQQLLLDTDSGIMLAADSGFC